MVKQNELRKGNLLLSEGEIVEVLTTDFYFDALDKNRKVVNICVDWDDVNYLPLSVDLLLAFGFEWYEPLKHYRIVIDDIWYSMTEDFKFSFVNLNYDETKEMPRKTIKYAHKLQNLFFEVSDVELEYNKNDI
jgi:hypothetical protein